METFGARSDFDKVIAVDFSRASATVDFATKVNVVACGLVETSMTAGCLNDPAYRQMVENCLRGSSDASEEIAGMVPVLGSPSASFATGTVYLVDGGQSAR